MSRTADMSRTIICSICSREKDQREKLLPAQERYLGSHIRKVAGEAAKRGMPFFVLSGVYGLVPAGTLVPYYDYLLEETQAGELAQKIAEQLAEHCVGEVHFYTKLKPNWQPYIHAVELAVRVHGVTLSIHNLLETD